MEAFWELKNGGFEREGLKMLNLKFVSWGLSMMLFISGLLSNLYIRQFEIDNNFGGWLIVLAIIGIFFLLLKRKVFYVVNGVYNILIAMWMIKNGLYYSVDGPVILGIAFAVLGVIELVRWLRNDD